MPDNPDGLRDPLARPFVPKIDGHPVKMGGRDFIVPPLNLKQLRRLEPKLAAMKAIDPTNVDMSQLDAFVDVVHAALSRNYPDLTLDEVDDMLDLGNLQEVVTAVCNVSGLKRAVPGEAAPGKP